jgi:hypothetical protein
LQNYGFNKPTFLVFPENFLERKLLEGGGGRRRTTTNKKKQEQDQRTRTGTTRHAFCCQKWEIIKIL